ncbi:MAG: hypothetical protein DRO99_03975, partial [Candidatus Aenigmatarchaeota archaeon]
SSWSYEGNCTNPERLVDEDWDTYGSVLNTEPGVNSCTWYINYTVPHTLQEAKLEHKQNTLSGSGPASTTVEISCMNGSAWSLVWEETNGGLSTINTTIPSDCYSGSKLMLKWTETHTDASSPFFSSYEERVWWNATSTVDDESGFDNVGFRNNTNITDSGRFDRSYRFWGDDDYVSLGQPEYLNFSPDQDEFTISAWIKIDSGKTGTIIGKGGENNAERQYQILIAADDLRAAIGGTNLVGGGSVNDGTWHHIVGRNYDESGIKKFRFYVDGVEDDTTITSGSATNNFDVLIGARRDTSNHDYAFMFNGSIDDLMIFNRSLTPSEIQSLHNATAYRYEHNFTGLSDGPHSVLGYSVDTTGGLGSSSVTATTETGSSVTICRRLDMPNTVYNLEADIEDNNLTGFCMNITADNVTLDCGGHYIKSDDNVPGVYSDNNNITIRNCIISMNLTGGTGIRLRSNNSLVYNNTLSNQYYGIHTSNSFNSRIENNVIRNVTKDSIYSFHDLYMSITNNTINRSKWYGVFLASTNHSNVSNNHIAYALDGIPIAYTSINNTVNDNLIEHTRWYSLYFHQSRNNTASGNRIYNCTHTNAGCIYFLASNNNVVTGGYVNKSTVFGIMMGGHNNNITSITINQTTKGDIYVNGNNNRISGRFHGWNNVQFGGGSNDVLYIGADSYFNGTAINITNDNSTVDLLWNRIKGDEDSGDYGINVNGHDNITIRNGIIEDFYYGIYMPASSNNGHVYNMTLNSNYWHGAYLSNADGNTFTNNTANSNGRNGFHVQASHYNQFINNTCTGNTLNGIMFSDGSQWNNATGNNMSYNKQIGIYLNGAHNNTVTDNTANNNTDYGIDVASSHNNTLMRNVANLNQKSGIYIPQGKSNNLTSNIANNNTEHGFLLYLNANYNDLLNNTAMHNGYHGIYLNGFNYWNEINGTTTSRNSGYGIMLDWASSFNVITGVTSDYNVDRGVYIDGGTWNIVQNSTMNGNFYGILTISSSNNIIRGNNVDKSEAYGIYLHESIYNRVMGNTAGLCSEQSCSGIYLYGSDHNNVSHNNASMNYYYGIELDSGSDNNTLVDNTASADLYGILLVGSHNNTIQNSTWTGNSYHGTYLYQSNGNLVKDNYANTCVYYTGAGLKVEAGSRDNILVNNTVYNYDYGIFMNQDVKNNTVRGNILGSEYSVGILMNSNSSNNTIDSNTMNNCQLSLCKGIYVNVSSDNNITNNLAHNNGMGAYLSINSTGNLLENNTLSDMTHFGILADGYSNRNVIRNNTAQYTAEGVYLYFSSNNTVLDNTIGSSRDYAIHAFSSANNRMINNTIWNCTTETEGCVLLDYSDNNLIENDVINLSQSYGIYVNYTSDNNVIRSVTSDQASHTDVFIGGSNTSVSGDFHSSTGIEMAGGNRTMYLNGNSTFKGNGINITADYSVLDGKGFTVNGDDSGADRGVSVDGYNSTTIKNGGIYQFGKGIYGHGANGINISNLIISSSGNFGYMSSVYGIQIEDSDNSTIINSFINNINATKEFIGA